MVQESSSENIALSRIAREAYKAVASLAGQLNSVCRERFNRRASESWLYLLLTRVGGSAMASSGSVSG